jgi:hypothetical protein
MELAFAIALGIVVAAIALYSIAFAFINFEIIAGAITLLALVFVALFFIADNPTIIWQISAFLLIGGVVALFLRKTDSEDRRLKTLHDEFISTQRLNIVFKSDRPNASLESIRDLSAKYAKCPFQLQIFIHNGWVSIDGGSARSIVQWKGDRLAKRLRYEQQNRPATNNASAVRVVALNDGLLAETQTWRISEPR